MNGGKCWLIHMNAKNCHINVKMADSISQLMMHKNSLFTIYLTFSLSIYSRDVNGCKKMLRKNNECLHRKEWRDITCKASKHLAYYIKRNASNIFTKWGIRLMVLISN